MNSAEAIEVYRAKRKLARRYASEHGGDEWGGCLPVLETVLPNVKELNTVSMGLIDAPLSHVRGTLAAGRAAALAGNFLPLLPESSEFAAKWISLYTSHMKEGIRDPGTAYEYLGYYYIVEGHKRVSVLTAAGALSVQLDVQRLIPAEDDDDEDVQIYKEFLAVNTRMPLKGMWFSKRGSFTDLYELSQREQDGNPDDRLFDAFLDFQKCCLELGFNAPPAIIGDCFLSYVRVYGIPYRLDPKELKRTVKPMERQFLYLSGTPAPPIAVSSVEIAADDRGGAEVLRHQLEHKDTLFFYRSREPRNDILPTFYGRMSEPAFVLGALAGSLTSTGVVGLADGACPDDAAAFVDGVKMAGVKNIVVSGTDVTELSVQGADTALLPYTGEDESGPGFPGIYARLVGVTSGHVTEYYAAAAWDFAAFRKLITAWLSDGSGPLRGYAPLSVPLHVELGLSSGLLKLHLNGAVLQRLSVKLVDILKSQYT